MTQIENLMAKAKEAYDKGNFGYAHALFEQILLQNPENSEAVHYLHISNFKIYDRKKIGILTNGFRFIFSIPVLILAQIFYIAENPGAKKLFESLLRKFPKNISYLKKLAKIYNFENNRIAEVFTLREILILDNKNIDALVDLGKIYTKEGDLQNAKKIYETLNKIAKNHHAAIEGLKNLAALEAIEERKKD